MSRPPMPPTDILAALASGPKTAAELAKIIDRDRSRVDRRMHALLAAGVVTYDEARRGTMIARVWRLAD